MNKVFIVAAKRTAIGSFGGTLAPLTPRQIGVPVVRELLKSTDVPVTAVQELIAGNVLAAGHGMNIARQIALDTGLPSTCSAYGINMVCGSGLKSVCLAAQAIQLGDADMIIAGGVESMSQACFASLNTRWGARMGSAELLDTMIQDGLTDAFGNGHMGGTAENIARQFSISREEQDAFALRSQSLAAESIRAKRFQSEIVPIEVQLKKNTINFDSDEYPRANTTLETLTKLRPAFDSTGTVTAGNASGINDGAAFVLLCSEKSLAKFSLQPLAQISAFASAGVAPEVMGLGPTVAVPLALAGANLSMNEIDCIESNEAFASQSIAVNRALCFPEEKVNAWGGAIALGHPIGASGCRILVTLIHRLTERGGGQGLATLCVGGGQGVAMVVNQHVQ